MAKVTLNMVEDGLSVWVIGRNQDGKQRPLRLSIMGGASQAEGYKIKVRPYYLVDDAAVTGPGGYSVDNPWLYLRDRGVRPVNYDDRPTQIWTTEEECADAIKRWDGENPNFLNEDA